jgi:hypothetical protein
MQQIEIYQEPDSIESLLSSQFNLTVEPLRESARANFVAQASCTTNDAPTAPGFLGWNASVSKLTEALRTKGWFREDIKNSPRLVHPSKNLEIMIATGNEATGNIHCIPKTKSNKGITTRNAVNSNELQIALFPDDMLPHVVRIHSDQSINKTNLRETWVLLVHVNVGEDNQSKLSCVRCELSLPIEMDDSGHITNWRKRIILPEIIVSPDDEIKFVEEFAPEQEIIIQRRN